MEQRYAALLRGINVSGKNKIAMRELKQGFEELGFTAVATHLNSGNMVFCCADTAPTMLADKIEAMLCARFALDVPVLVLLQADLDERLRHAPDWWGTDDKEIYDNLIFLMPPLSYAAFYAEIGAPKDEYEQVQPYQDVVFWSFRRSAYQKTNWWSKTASAAIKDQITIRTAGTVRKIVRL